MTHRNVRTIPSLLCICGLLGTLLLQGCSKTEESTSQPPNTGMNKDIGAMYKGPSPGFGGPQANLPEPTGPFAAGKKIFNAHCIRCHSDGSVAMKGPPMGEGAKEGFKGGFKGKKGFRGPDLSKVAANENHTPEWIRDHILDPQIHKEDSSMPKFQGKLSEDDLKNLVDYLSSLK
jgi:mono/diheme cytochrome c family protein